LSSRSRRSGRRQLEALHDLLRGVGLAVRLADDPDDLVERVEDGLEAFEDVDAPLERRQLVLEALGDDFKAKCRKCQRSA